MKGIDNDNDETSEEYKKKLAISPILRRISSICSGNNSDNDNLSNINSSENTDGNSSYSKSNSSDMIEVMLKKRVKELDQDINGWEIRHKALLTSFKALENEYGELEKRIVSFFLIFK